MADPQVNTKPWSNDLDDLGVPGTPFYETSM